MVIARAVDLEKVDVGLGFCNSFVIYVYFSVFSGLVYVECNDLSVFKFLHDVDLMRFPVCDLGHVDNDFVSESVGVHAFDIGLIFC